MEVLGACAHDGLPTFIAHLLCMRILRIGGVGVNPLLGVIL